MNQKKQRRNSDKNRGAVFEGPKSYPILGCTLSFIANRHRVSQWITELLRLSPTQTIVLKRLGGIHQIITANPANVQHILKSKFPNYPKGQFGREIMADFLGQGIVNSDGEPWKFQRKIAIHGFNTKSLKKFIHHVVEEELFTRLIPLLEKAAMENMILDLQDVLESFAFDNICNIAFGWDPCCLHVDALLESEFAEAFDSAATLSSERFRSLAPWSWKLKRLFDIGTERKLRISIDKVKGLAIELIQRKKAEARPTGIEVEDLLSRFLNAGIDEDIIRDIVICFVLAGRDTTSAALTWFFWLLARHPHVEEAIIKEIGHKDGINMGLDDIKDLNYLHASIYESMRLYPPVPVDTKEAAREDVLPDGTKVRKGSRVSYHPYAMGRMEALWGKDYEDFKPERWLDKENGMFVPCDSFKYAVFQAGPRICMGKEMAFVQMKTVVVALLKRFRIRIANSNFKAVYVLGLTSKMEGGFSVRIEKRSEKVLA
ncbi:cytochrome P450 94A1 [Amborella trichopoda]|uniref:Cytochrome P450 n=1 Tax=Amborella trichopoda TaxID=13333 RepID=W1NUV0_AMBTC|nr:cytochrome P450 94A1 [Amborella trichopoda]ERN01407.1 hypothetical protein AMTR_s00002p00263780 [Amborella trichopoda]|eukprot:XP_006838838.1 cytochrome P450 94A1 [Amborella trichopoda]